MRSPLLLCLGLALAGPAFAETPPGFVLKWGSSGSAPGEFNRPSDVLIDGSTVYVSDMLNNRIQKFSPTGSYLGQITAGLDFPTGMAVGPDGILNVADGNNHRIARFDGAGNLVGSWGGFGAGDGQLNFPSAVDFDAAGNLYVADTNNHRIQKFSPSGQFLAQWGTLGTGIGQFNNPGGIAIRGNSVYVSDRINSRIQKFTLDGTFLLTWGTCCAGDANFNTPGCVALDGTGYVYVADSGHHRIQKFTPDGQLITKWGHYGSGDGEFWSPSGVAVDAMGNVYVSDFANDRIQKFDPAVNPPPSPPPDCNTNPKILLHVASPTTKNQCGTPNLPSLRDAAVKEGVSTASGPFYFVYLMVVPGNIGSLAGVQCGISYDSGATGAVNGSGIDIFHWTLCADLQFPEAAWPASGSGNTMTWEPVGNCQTGAAVAGFFYLAAYSPDLLKVIPRPADEIAQVATCDPVVEHTLTPNDLGYVAFSPGAVVPGCNPCVRNCDEAAPVPVRPTTWSAIKSLLRQDPSAQ